MKRIVLFFMLGWLITGTQAQDQAVLRKKQFNLAEGVAINGYDPVAYFTPGKAVKGSKENAVAYEGVIYYFSTAANKEEFKKNPAKTT